MLPIRSHESTPALFTAGPINRLDSLFDRFLGEDGLTGRAWGNMPLAMWEDDDHIYVEAELPGMTDRDVEATVHEGMLYIRGERKREAGRRCLYDGRSYGRFERVLTLPEAVNTDEVRAQMKDGVLSVTFTKTPEAKPKKISIATG